MKQILIAITKCELNTRTQNSKNKKKTEKMKKEE